MARGDLVGDRKGGDHSRERPRANRRLGENLARSCTGVRMGVCGGGAGVAMGVRGWGCPDSCVGAATDLSASGMRRGDMAEGVWGAARPLRGETEQLRRRFFAVATAGTESLQTPAGLGFSGPLPASRAHAGWLWAAAPFAAEAHSPGLGRG
mmetsp:Transcript_2414/g.7630  ORF Transcript_2414/g.7630 Transcript_2414/m.7630 type:complete len:152 (-) Transcript_2414:537-992(-)